MKTLITGALGATEEEIRQLSALGLDITLHPDERQSVEHPEQYEAVVCNGLFTFHDIATFTRLRHIQLTSAGYDRAPLDYIQAHNIKIYNAAGVYSVPMAEFALCGVLQLSKQSKFFFENQKQHRWEKHRGLFELAGKTVCIVGCGNVGNACASRFRAMGCRVIGVNRSPKQDPLYDHIFPLSQLHQALANADIVVLSIALTNETRHLMDHSALSAMKPGAVLVNLARGAIVDTNALIPALRSHLGGAVLDVFEEEPLSPDSPLWDMEQVVLTPHNSFVGEGNHRRLMEIIVNNLSEYTEV